MTLGPLLKFVNKTYLMPNYLMVRISPALNLAIASRSIGLHYVRQPSLKPISKVLNLPVPNSSPPSFPNLTSDILSFRTLTSKTPIFPRLTSHAPSSPTPTFEEPIFATPSY